MQHRGWRADERWAVVAASTLWLLVPLMILPEGLDFSRLTVAAGTDANSGGAGNTPSHLLWMLALGASSALLLWRAALSFRLMGEINPWFLVLLVLACFSLGWSIDPGLSLRRFVRVLALVSCLVVFVCVGWHERRLQAVLRPLLTSLLLGSLVFGLVWPEYAIHTETSHELRGAWRGLTSHKNALGSLAATGCLLWCHAGLSREVRPGRSLAGVGVALACLLLSRSTTSLLAALICCGILLLLLPATGGRRRWLGRLAIPTLCASLFFGLTSVSSQPGVSLVSAPIALLAGKDTSLTGRTAIWAIVREHIALRPTLGSGYGAYWAPNRGRGTESAIFVRRLAGFYPGSAHNGYLDLTNDLGVVGLAALAAYLISHVRTALLVSSTAWAPALLCFGIWLQQAITNLSESHWFNVTSVDFVFMSAATFTLARLQLQQQFKAIHGPLPMAHA